MSAIDTPFLYNFTDRYGPYLNPLPEANTFREAMRMVPPRDRSGRQFRGPLQASLSLGQTIDITGTSYALNDPRPAGQLEYILDGCDLMLRDRVPDSMRLKGMNGASLSGDDAAYWEPLDLVMETMSLGIAHLLEIAMMFGPGSGTTIQDDIGVVTGNTSFPGTTPVAAGTGPNWNSLTSPIVQITRPSWSAALWTNSGDGGNANGGMLVDVLNAAGTAVVANNIKVVGVADPENCQVTMAATSGTTVGAGTAVAEGQRFVPAGWYQKCNLGVSGILRNTGNFANINAATNAVWRARQASAGGAMSRAKILQMCAKLFNNGARKGLMGWICANTFAELAEETSNPGSSGGQWFENGAETRVQGATKLEYIGPVGRVELRLHEYQKQGSMFLIEPENAVRIGASDITWRGADGNEPILFPLPNNAGSELRVMSQQAPLLRIPYRCAIFNGILNAGDDNAAA